MEVKQFTDSLFVPLMFQIECLVEDEPEFIVCDTAHILRQSGWVMTEIGPFLPDLVRIEFTFDGNINDVETFDYMKSTVYSIIATKPKFFDYDNSDTLSSYQNDNLMKGILNCFDGIVKLPRQFSDVYASLLEFNWSYRVATGIIIGTEVDADNNLTFVPHDISL